MTDFKDEFYSSYVQTHLKGMGGANLTLRSPYLKFFIKKFFPKNRDSKILEIGCGHGALLHFARQAGYSNIEGFDISEEQVNLAVEMGITGVSLADSSIFLATLKPGTFDAIIAIDVFEHIEKNELLDLLKQIRRVLAKNGRLIFHVPNAVSPFFGRIRYGDFTHVQAFTQDSMRQLLSVSGYGKATFYEEAPIVHGPISAVRWILWKFIREILRLMFAVETGKINEIFSQNLVGITVNSNSEK